MSANESAQTLVSCAVAQCSCSHGSKVLFTCVCVTLLAGELKYCKNGRRAGTLMHVDCSLPLWAFFDIYGTTNKLESLGKVLLGASIYVCRFCLLFL